MGTKKIFTLKWQRSHKLEAVRVCQSGITRWKIQGLYISGKRTRKFFVTHQEELEFIATENAKSRNLGERARNIPGHLHEDALRANDILEEYGVMIEEAAKFSSARHRYFSAFGMLPALHSSASGIPVA